ncbi:hypothetical protein KX816_08035 [Sphingosinicellaceae bacterium]|nr:hypothetical protein KX816_08035 [Sphingosinicellaceae bacterium]
MLRRIGFAVAAALLIAASPEPPELWMGAMHGETPTTLTGATVLDLAALDQLVATAKPVLVDLSKADVRPAGMAPEMPWLPQHRSIPGAAWLPGAGIGDIGPEREALFVQRIAALTGGDKARPIVSFCHPDCWASWNAGKRLVRLGYTKVYWFPQGIDGWEKSHDTAVVAADAAWVGAPTTK